MKSISPVAIIIATGMAALFIAVTLFRPLMPVDETRYLSVAWEMFSQNHWLLPTLNFEAYSHKPPMLFWLIHTAWDVFGVQVWPARVIAFLGMGGLLFMTWRLARILVPQAANHATLLMAGLPAFLVYSSMIMFDTILGIWVVMAMIAVWQAAQMKQLRWWLMFGALLGLGILTKGPVALIYMLCPALLAPLWTQQHWRRWYAGVVIAVLIGAAIALSWAIPAAIVGGTEYRDKIFITQSAGRMVNAFDHREPVWFYIPVLLGFMLPVLAWPALWSKQLKALPQTQVVRFLLCWVVPVFLLFTAINSKQIHYMIPILPGLAILALVALSRGSRKAGWIAVPLALMALPSVAVLVGAYDARLDVALVHIVVTAGLIAFAHKDFDKGFVALPVAAFMLAIMIHVQAGQQMLPRYNLTPLADAIHQYEDRPMAAAPKYDGEYGFAMRVAKPIESIGREDLHSWFKKNPDGVVILRYKKPCWVEDYHVLYSQGFRRDETLAIIESPKVLPAEDPQAKPQRCI